MARFTGANVVLKHQYPPRVVYSDREALAAFIGWIAEAIEICPLSEDTKVVVDALIAGQQHHFDYTGFTVARIDKFLEWFRLASEHHAPDEKASKQVTTLSSYRDQLDCYQSQFRNYWM